ncbi:MAG: hypothetical protein ABIJ18_05305 [archaeon]
MSEWEDYRNGSIEHIKLPGIGLDLEGDFFDTVPSRAISCKRRDNLIIPNSQQIRIISYFSLLYMLPECDFAPTTIWKFGDFY